ncbi:MAG: hypothetical protein ACRD3D_06985 [Terriglobia bacterium]
MPNPGTLTPASKTPSALCLTDPRLSGVRASLLCSTRYQPVAVTSPLLEGLLVMAGQIDGLDGVPLTPPELEVIKKIFATSVDASRIRLLRTGIANAPTTLGNQIRIAPNQRTDTPDWLSTLVHETTHVWQYQTRGTNYITDSIYHQLRAQVAMGTRSGAYFNYRLTKGSSFSDYSAEEQAQIVEDYYDITVLYAGKSGTPRWVDVRRPDLPLYQALILQLRSAIPMPDNEIYQRNLMSLPLDQRFPGASSPYGAISVVPLIKITF